jgi:hypothetical protein
MKVFFGGQLQLGTTQQGSYPLVNLVMIKSWHRNDIWSAVPKLKLLRAT